MEPERPRRAFEFHFAIDADQIETIGPPCVGGLDSIAHLIYQRGDLNTQLSDAAFGDRAALFRRFWIGEDNVVPHVARGLPGVARMRFANIYDVERGLILILLIKSVERGNLPAKRRSSVAAEDQHDGLRSAKTRQLNLRGAVRRFQRKVGGGIAHLQMTRSGVHPKRLEGQHHERGPRHFRHDGAERIGRLTHGERQSGNQSRVQDNESEHYAQNDPHPG